MRLGSSIRRRQFRSDGRFQWPETKKWVRLGQLKLSRESGFVGGAVVVLGLVFGYVVSTRLLFPMPAPPGDLGSRDFLHHHQDCSCPTAQSCRSGRCTDDPLQFPAVFVAEGESLGLAPHGV